MTTPGHDGEHGGPMDRIKSVWRDALGAREEPHDGADGGQARGGQYGSLGGAQQTEGGTVPTAYQAPPRTAGPDRSGGPLPMPSAPRGLPRILPRDDSNGHDGRPGVEPTVAQPVPWQAPRPMSQPMAQPINPHQIAPPQSTPQQVVPQPINQRPLPQRAAPQPLRSVPHPLPQSGPQQMPPQITQAQPVPLPLPQRSAPPDEPDRTAAEPPTTWHPVTTAAVDEPTESAQPRSEMAEADPPATADLTGPQSATPASDAEPAAVHEEAGDQGLDDPLDADAPAAGRTPEAAAARPAEPIRRPVWTEPERATPPPPAGTDRADTPDRPMPALSAVPTPVPTPVPSPVPPARDRLPSHLPSDIPSHITDAAAGAWTRQQNGTSTRPQGRHELFDAPYREADSMPDPEPVPTSPSRAAADAAQVSAPVQSPPANGQRFVPGDRAGEYADRWAAVKSEFVDEPREAVRKADALVGELLADIARSLAQQRAQLDRGLDTDATSTEDLRQAMHRYREFFDRLLIL